MSKVSISPGFSENERPIIADLYWSAFKEKLSIPLGPAAKAKTFLAANAQPEFTLCARNEKNKIIGITGFKTINGGMMGGDFASFKNVYGSLGAVWRMVLLSVFDRPFAPNDVVIDTICVNKTKQGQGIGTQLLDYMIRLAQHQNAQRISLNVVDTNPRAHALYERIGFKKQSPTSIGPFCTFFKFRTFTTLILEIPENCRDAAN